MKAIKVYRFQLGVPDDLGPEGGVADWRPLPDAAYASGRAQRLFDALGGVEVWDDWVRPLRVGPDGRWGCFAPGKFAVEEAAPETI